jgi:hypothetical protein
LILSLFETDISSKQEEESLEKEILELKGRLRDLNDELKTSVNRSYDILGTGQRVNLGSSRRTIEDNDDDHSNTTEHGNEEQTHVDNEESDPLFANYPSSNSESPSLREESTLKQKVTFSFVCHMRGFPKLNPLYDNLSILTFILGGR